VKTKRKKKEKGKNAQDKSLANIYDATEIGSSDDSNRSGTLGKSCRQFLGNPTQRWDKREPESGKKGDPLTGFIGDASVRQSTLLSTQDRGEASSETVGKSSKRNHRLSSRQIPEGV